MYKITVHRKHLVQVELDNIEQVDLIRRAFNKMAMIWTDPPMFELSEGMKFGFMAYTTKENVKHTFNYVGISKDPFRDPNARIPQEYNPNFVGRLYYDTKFVRKKMHRNNYLDQFAVDALPTWFEVKKPQRLTRKHMKGVRSSERKYEAQRRKSESDIVSSPVKTGVVHKRTHRKVTYPMEGNDGSRQVGGSSRHQHRRS